jgi:hypothetical protein
VAYSKVGACNLDVGSKRGTSVERLGEIYLMSGRVSVLRMAGVNPSDVDVPFGIQGKGRIGREAFALPAGPYAGREGLSAIR